MSVFPRSKKLSRQERFSTPCLVIPSAGGNGNYRTEVACKNITLAGGNKSRNRLHVQRRCSFENKPILLSAVCYLAKPTTLSSGRGRSYILRICLIHKGQDGITNMFTASKCVRTTPVIATLPTRRKKPPAPAGAARPSMSVGRDTFDAACFTETLASRKIGPGNGPGNGAARH